jgi:hypothetical protein
VVLQQRPVMVSGVAALRLNPHQQPTLRLIQVREDRRELRHQHLAASSLPPILQLTCRIPGAYRLFPANSKVPGTAPRVPLSPRGWSSSTS